MSNYLDCKKVETAIRRAKDMLIKSATENGVYENFGQKEVREITDRFVDICDYSDYMNSVRQKISSFGKWCMEFGVGFIYSVNEERMVLKEVEYRGKKYQWNEDDEVYYSMETDEAYLSLDFAEKIVGHRR